MILWFRDLSLTLRGALETFGAVTIFFLDIVARSPRTFVRRFRLVVAQIYNAGTLSLVIVGEGRLDGEERPGHVAPFHDAVVVLKTSDLHRYIHFLVDEPGYPPCSHDVERVQQNGS